MCLGIYNDFWGLKLVMFCLILLLAVSSLAYEKVCVLFNIAALQSAVASTQSTENDEGLRLAAKLFQVSWK